MSQAQQTREEWLIQEIAEMMVDVQTIKQQKSWQAYTSAKRLIHKLNKELDDITKDKAANFNPTSVDDVAEYLLSEMPEAVWAHPTILAKVDACRSA